jgi:hypothetical protein
MTTRRPPPRGKLAAPADASNELDDDLSAIDLDAADERAIDRAIASVREGRGVSLATFRSILRRL